MSSLHQPMLSAARWVARTRQAPVAWRRCASGGPVTSKAAADPNVVKAPFSAPTEESLDSQGSGSMTVFPQEGLQPDGNASPPLLPGTPSAHHDSSQAPREAKPVEQGIGRVATSTTVDTMLGGGPSAIASQPFEAQEAQASEPENRGLGNFKPTDNATASSKPPFEKTALKWAESQSNAIPFLKQAVEQLPKEEPFKFEDRPLKRDEQRGLYLLAGLVAGGWLLGGLGSS